MNRILAFGVIVLCLIIGLNSCSSKSKSEKETIGNQSIKGVWVTNVASDALSSHAKIKETVEVCKKAGITDIYMVVWNKSRTLYKSAIMKEFLGKEIDEVYGDRDPLQEMIDEGHKAGIRVHAWFEYGFAASYGDSGGEIIAKKPEWKAINNEGKLVNKNGFDWMNTMNPEVQDFIKSLVLEVVKNYKVDGIQGDDRLPAMPSTGGYDSYTVEMYKKEHNGQTPPTDYMDANWLTWRANKLTDFLGQLYKEVKAVNPDVVVSMAPSIHPWAKEEYLQDWPTWLEKGFCDNVIPQIYRYDIEKYTATLKAQVEFLPADAKDKFFAGVLLQVNEKNPTPEFLDAMIDANRAAGVNGEVFFFYEGLTKFPEYFEGGVYQKK